MDRQPAVAGRFYPEAPEELYAQVDGFLGATQTEEPAIAVIAPHAGYIYSGAIAGEAYAGVRVPRLAVVMCPNHTGAGARAAVMTRGNFRVPGVSVPIDGSLAEELRGVALLTDDPQAHLREHALEVHLPFLVRKNPKVRIVPVCLSYMPFASCVRIGHALADVVENHGRDVLIVASTDMSHYVPAEVARTLDGLALERVRELDPEGLYRVVAENEISMCGVIPTTIALVAARALGATSAELVRYGSSGEVSGDMSRVVGYAGLVVR